LGINRYLSRVLFQPRYADLEECYFEASTKGSHHKKHLTVKRLACYYREILYIIFILYSFADFLKPNKLREEEYLRHSFLDTSRTHSPIRPFTMVYCEYTNLIVAFSLSVAIQCGHLRTQIIVLFQKISILPPTEGFLGLNPLPLWKFQFRLISSFKDFGL